LAEEAAAVLSGDAVRALLDAGRSVVAELDRDRVARTSVDAARTLTGATFGVLFYDRAGGSGGSFTRRALSGLRREAFEGLAPPRATGILAPTFRGLATVLDGDVTTVPPQLPEGEVEVRSCLATPIVGPDGEVLGALVLGHPKPGHFAAQDELLIEGIAGLASVAMANAREYRAQSEIAQALQRAMLPAIGFHEGVEVAVRYRPAARRAQVGGDWYDVLPLADGRLALTVGDVAGHNVTAAARMGVVRNALSVHVLREVDPGRSLLALEDHLVGTGQKGFVTVVQALFDPADASVAIARAGHLPPLLVPAHGVPRFVGSDPSPPVGVGLLRQAPETQRVQLELGDTILFFTDGLVEQRLTATDVRMTRLRALVGTLGETSAEQLCDEILDRFVGPGGADDDVAMLALRPLFHVPARAGGPSAADR
jgi:hypothetical protein